VKETGAENEYRQSNATAQSARAPEQEPEYQDEEYTKPPPSDGDGRGKNDYGNSSKPANPGKPIKKKGI
jgi:hypothetical protein